MILFRFRNSEQTEGAIQPSRVLSQNGLRMSNPNPLLMQAVQEAAESLTDALQVVIFEGELLARDGSGGREAQERAIRLVKAARRAVVLCRCLFGASGRAIAEQSGELKAERSDNS